MNSSTLATALTALGSDVAMPTLDATGTACVDVPPHLWREAAQRLVEMGAVLDWLAGVDLGPTPDADGFVEVVAMFMDADDCVLLSTHVGYGEALPTLVDICPSAPWHERETAEMLGVHFAGGDPRRLLLPPDAIGFPLRRDYVLPPRLETPWPGDAGGRRSRVPGVNPEWRR